MIIMQVLPSLNSGGVERGAIDMANYIANLGHKSIIVSSGGKLELFLDKRVNHIILDVKSKNPLKILLNISRIKNLIKKNKVDILHVRSRVPAWSCFYAIKNTNCKLVNTFHGTYSTKLIFNNSFFKKKYNKIMLCGHKIIAVSEFIKNHIRETYPSKFDYSKIEVIHRGADLKYFNKDLISTSSEASLIKEWQIPSGKKIIMLPGRITKWKGHELLIDALSLIDRDDFLCLFIGDSSKKRYINRLEKKLSKLMIENKVKFINHTNNMAIAYSICDVIISASTQPEAFGRIAIEAGAMNKIIIATNIGGSKETVIDDKTGFLVDFKNPLKMADMISKVLSMKDEDKIKIGKEARKNIEENFSNKLMYEKTVKIYQNLLKN